MKSCKSEEELLNDLSDGSQKLAEYVGSTMGPRGQNIILRSGDEEPVITKDGVTVASFFGIKDDYKDLGAEVVKQSAIETNKKAGDGTTTATILANKIFQTALSQIIRSSHKEASAKNIRKGIRKKKEEVLEFLEDQSRPIKSKEDVKHIAKISSNGDEQIGQMIADAVDKVGKDGSIIVEESGKVKTELEFVEGFQFPSGFCSSKFINDERNKKVYFDKKNPLIMVTDHKVDDVTCMMETLSKVQQDGSPLVIVANDITGQALAAFITNSVRGNMPVAAVRAPFYGERRREFLEDLAISTGANFISGKQGDRLEDVRMQDFGACDSVEITQNKTTIVGGKGNLEKIDKQIEGLKKTVDREEDIEKAEKIQDRIARLSSGVAIINVGASTKVELQENKHRVEDALEAVNSAQDEGILPGGGSMLLRASRELKKSNTLENSEEKIGAGILLESLEAPIRQMCRNAGEPEDVVINKIIEQDQKEIGYDLETRKIVDLFEEGVIDPMKVTRNALQNAVSAASTLLMSNGAIVEDISEDEQ